MTNVVTRYVYDVAERAIKTAAQTELAYLAVNTVKGAMFNAFHGVDWYTALGFAAGGAIFSVLTSLASQPIGDPFSASILPTQGNTPAK
jgi:uncharacterized membrane protein YfcA